MDSRIAGVRGNLSGKPLKALENGCRHGVFFLRRDGGSIFRRRMGGRGIGVFHTVADSVAQEVASGALEPFSGSRCSTAELLRLQPGQILRDRCRAPSRRRCWRCDWCSISMYAPLDQYRLGVLLKAGPPPTDAPWVCYRSRVVKAPVQMEGTGQRRSARPEKSPQGRGRLASHGETVCSTRSTRGWRGNLSA